MKLEIGCGPESRWLPDTDGIDLIDFGQKYVGDFLTFKFPKKYDELYAHHVIEHLPDTVAFFNKVGEVLKPGGTIDIRVPLFPFEQSIIDPTHVKLIPGVPFFQYFTKDSPAGHCYSKKEFEIVIAHEGRWEWEMHCILRLK